jgi:glycosyltransferase involved in cell wall biosynthesis
MKLLIVTDAVYPQVNGVVTTYTHLVKELTKLGVTTTLLSIHSKNIKSFKLPFYPEIRLAWNTWNVKDRIKEINPDMIHIATEHSMGVAAKLFCDKKGIPYTTSYHTKLPEFIKSKFWLFPLSIGYRYMRWFHGNAKTTFVTNESMYDLLRNKGFKQPLFILGRAADTDIFSPSKRTYHQDHVRPILLYAGRVSTEKNISAFLNLPCDLGDKIVVGDGPQLEYLKKNYPNVLFTGYKFGEDLAEAYANAEVFVFPSLTDTHGIVMTEANACGTPVAAYYVQGPKDYIINGLNGYVSDDLCESIEQCLKITDRKGIARYIRENYQWSSIAKEFLSKLSIIEENISNYSASYSNSK